MARSTESFKTFTDRTVRINFIPLIKFTQCGALFGRRWHPQTVRPKSQHKMFVKHQVCPHMFLRAKAVFPKIRGQHAYIMG